MDVSIERGRVIPQFEHLSSLLIKPTHLSWPLLPRTVYTQTSRHIQSIFISKKEVKQRRTSSRSRSSSSPSSYLPMRTRVFMCTHASCSRRARADCLTECGRDYQRAHGANTNKNTNGHTDRTRKRSSKGGKERERSQRTHSTRACHERRVCSV